MQPKYQMNKIDSHQHFWKYDVARHQWITPQMKAIRHDFLPKDLVNILENNDIEGTVAVQADSTEDETNFLIELANEYSFIKGVVGWVDLRDEKVAQRLEYYSNFKKVVGFRHVVQDEPDPNFLLDQSFLNGIALLEPLNYTYDVLIYEKQLPTANLFLKRFPNQKFVLDHIAKPKIAINQIKPWENQIREIAKNENCYCKISGLVTENDWNLWNEADFKPYLDVIFEAFGTKRLMFGSDWPVCMLAASYSQVIEIIDNYIRDLSDFEKDRIWRQNATDFYNLK
jgi:L-fuconolactonase